MRSTVAGRSVDTIVFIQIGVWAFRNPLTTRCIIEVGIDTELWTCGTLPR